MFQTLLMPLDPQKQHRPIFTMLSQGTTRQTFRVFVCHVNAMPSLLNGLRMLPMLCGLGHFSNPKSSFAMASAAVLLQQHCVSSSAHSKQTDLSHWLLIWVPQHLHNTCGGDNGDLEIW